MGGAGTRCASRPWHDEPVTCKPGRRYNRAGLAFRVRDVKRLVMAATAGLSAAMTVLGIVFLVLNCHAVPQYEDTGELLKLSDTLQVEQYRGIVYPLLILLEQIYRPDLARLYRFPLTAARRLSAVFVGRARDRTVRRIFEGTSARAWSRMAGRRGVRCFIQSAFNALRRDSFDGFARLVADDRAARRVAPCSGETGEPASVPDVDDDCQCSNDHRIVPAGRKAVSVRGDVSGRSRRHCDSNEAVEAAAERAARACCSSSRFWW